MLLYYGRSRDACFQQVRMATVKEDRPRGGPWPVHLVFPLTAITMLTLIFTSIGALATEGTKDIHYSEREDEGQLCTNFSFHPLPVPSPRRTAYGWRWTMRRICLLLRSWKTG